MSKLWLAVPLLLTACSFDRSGISVPVADLRSGDLARLDARRDAVDSTAPDPCSPNPCKNGGTCAPGDGGAICSCPPAFAGPSCGTCALGHEGATCEACGETKLTIQACGHPSIACSKWIDGANGTSTGDSCPSVGGCFATDIDLDLGFRRFVHRLRFLSDWWAKRPGTFELLASDDNVHFSSVMNGRSNKAPWKCVQGEPCTAEVPTECCPGGVTQDTSVVGTSYPKWDDFTFSGVTARYWRFRILATDDPDSLIMRELELHGHDCLGELACANSHCGDGVCTGQEAASCSCAHCQPTASCASAFTGEAPACTKPAR